MSDKVAKPWWEGRVFDHPTTKNKVKFLSLPKEEQDKLNQYVQEQKKIKDLKKSPSKTEVPEKSPEKKVVPKEKDPKKQPQKKNLIRR